MLYLIFLAHYVGDFLCQTHRMAMNKSTNNGWLFVHVFIYCLILALFGSIWLFNDLYYVGLWVITNGFLHFGTDYLTSRWTLSIRMKEPVNHSYFFKVIGLDQLIHVCCLVFTYKCIVM